MESVEKNKNNTQHNKNDNITAMRDKDKAKTEIGNNTIHMAMNALIKTLLLKVSSYC